MSRDSIIDRIAREQRVERMARVVCKGKRVQESDLVQIAYTMLCEKPAEWVEKADVEGWLPFWLLNLVKRLATEKRGRYGSLYRSYSYKALPISEETLNIPDDAD